MTGGFHFLCPFCEFYENVESCEKCAATKFSDQTLPVNCQKMQLDSTHFYAYGFIVLSGLLLSRGVFQMKSTR